MFTDITLFFTTFIIGLLGSSHCIGMCGGLQQLFIQMQPKNTRVSPLYIYHLGRLTGYLIITAIVAILLSRFAEQTAGFVPYANLIRILAAIIILYLGLNHFFRFPKFHRLAQPAQILWRHMRQLASPIMPPKNLVQVYAIGIIWGWIPCSLVYSALAVALSGQTVTDSLVAMTCFAVGTMPALIGIGLLSKKLQDIKQYRSFFALLLIGLGCYAIASFWI